MIRVVLPAHLRTLARLGNDEVQVQVNGQPTLGAVLDAIEASYPVSAARSATTATEKRRPFVRFFACEQDLSHESPGHALARCRRQRRRTVSWSLARRPEGKAGLPAEAKLRTHSVLPP